MSTAYYFRGAGEQAHTFEDLGNTDEKKKRINIRLPFYLILCNFPDPHISL